MKKQKNDKLDIKLDPEEQELSDELDRAIDDGTLKSIEGLAEEIELAKEAAADYFRKDARVNIRISSNDLVKLKQKAAYEGMPYQTLIASILHKYAAGHLGKHKR
jgi:predicted DNA binding CopG/RHH family protein